MLSGYSVSASHVVGRGFAPGRLIPNTIIKMVQTAGYAGVKVGVGQ